MDLGPSSPDRPRPRRVSKPIDGVPLPTDPFHTVQVPAPYAAYRETGGTSAAGIMPLIVRQMGDDPAVQAMLAAEAQRIAGKADRAMVARPVRRLAEFVDTATAGMIPADTLLGPETPAPPPRWILHLNTRKPSLWRRYWAWNLRAWSWCTDHVGVLALAALALGAGPAAGLLTGIAWVPLLVGFVAAVLWAAFDLRYEPWAASVPVELVRVSDPAAGFTWRDVEQVAFTPICACPRCNLLALHWIAVHGLVSDTLAGQPHPAGLVWRECVGDGCGFVWPQIG